MAGIDIQAKVKKGLARAIVKTSSASADLVYKIERTSNGGTPMNPIAPTETEILLVDAIFKSYHDTQIDQTLILSGDRQLVTNGDVLIEPNDIIQIGIERFIVQPSVDVKNPAGVPLAYIAQVRPTGSLSGPLISTIVMGDLSLDTGQPNSVGFFNDGGLSAGSLSPSVIIGGQQVNAFYSDVKSGSGEYWIRVSALSSMLDVGNIAVSVGGNQQVFTYNALGYYENLSVSSSYFDYLKTIQDIPTDFFVVT